MTLFPEPQLLRAFLLLGLVIHKGLWEVLKKQGHTRTPRSPNNSRSRVKAFIKLGKMGVLAFLVIQVCFLDVLPILSEPFILRIVGTLFYSAGLVIAILARVQLGSNWSDLEDAKVNKYQVLVTGGLYKHIRHPIYAGDLLLLAGLQMALNCWLVLSVIVALPLVLKLASREELLMLESFRNYESYRERTKRMIPYIFL